MFAAAALASATAAPGIAVHTANVARDNVHDVADADDAVDAIDASVRNGTDIAVSIAAFIFSEAGASACYGAAAAVVPASALTTCMYGRRRCDVGAA